MMGFVAQRMRTIIIVRVLTIVLSVFAVIYGAGMRAYAESAPVEANRVVQLDWEPIAGAEKYELEWFTGASCDDRVGEETVTKAKWGKRLPAGQYCLHLRAVSDSGKPGQWTEMERFAVAPKPPAGLTRVGASFEWEWKKVPYAKSYEVEVSDPQGRVVYRERTKSNSIKIPDAAILGRNLANGMAPGDFEIAVKTEVDGLPASAPAVDAFPRSGAKIAESRAGGGARSGDRSPAQQKLEAKVRVYDGPDWRLRFGLGQGDWDYQAKQRFGGSTSESTNSRSGVSRFALTGEYFSTGKWGGWVAAQSQKATISTKSVGATVLSAGVHYQLWRDKRWGPKLTVGLGPRYQLVPFQVENAQSATSNSSAKEPWFLGVQTFGLESRIGSTYGFSDNWAVAASLKISWAPKQDHLTPISRMGQSGTELELGPVYRLSESFWLRAGVYTTESTFDGSNSDTRLKIVDSGVFFDLTARTGSAEVRSPASIMSYREDLANLWHLSVSAPVGSRSVTFMHLVDASATNGNDPYRLTGAYSTMGIEANAERRFSESSRWSVGTNFNMEQISYPSKKTTDSAFSGYGAYDLLFASRIDTRLRVFGGLGIRSTAVVLPPDSATSNASSNTTTEYTTTLSAVEGIGGFNIQRNWSPRFTSSLDASAARPVLTPGATIVGTSYHALIGLNVGYKLTPRLSVTGGYEIQEHRLVLESKETSNATGGVEKSADSDISYSQSQLRLGLQLNW